MSLSKGSTALAEVACLLDTRDTWEYVEMARMSQSVPIHETGSDVILMLEADHK